MTPLSAIGCQTNGILKVQVYHIWIIFKIWFWRVSSWQDLCYRKTPTIELWIIADFEKIVLYWESSLERVAHFKTTHKIKVYFYVYI